MKIIYLTMCVIGFVLPWTQFGPWLMENDFSLTLFFQDAFAERLSAFAWYDVIVSGVVLIIFVVVEGKRARIKHLWAPFLALAVVGVSLALPLFLLQREISLEIVKT